MAFPVFDALLIFDSDILLYVSLPINAVAENYPKIEA